MQKRVGYARIVVLRRMAGLFVVAFAALVAGSLSPACRTPTQVTLELRTTGTLTCAQLKGVAIVVASDSQKAEERMRLDSLSAQVLRGQCGSDPHLLGTLVLTPSGSSGAVIVRARISDLPEATCTPPRYLGCIVARRAFAFIDHASVTLPISLEIACLDVPCDVVSSCRTGKCVSSEASCSESAGRCDSKSEPQFERDGGPIPVPPETEVIVDGGPDGADAADAADAADSADGATVGPDDGATLDAPSDAPGDADLTGRTNFCPAPGGNVDCRLTPTTPVCCRLDDGGFGCSSVAQCTTRHYPCVGALPCTTAGEYCCGFVPIMPMSQPSSNCAAGSCPGGNHYCFADQDCPGAMRCTGVDVFSVSPGDASRLWVCQ